LPTAAQLTGRLHGLPTASDLIIIIIIIIIITISIITTTTTTIIIIIQKILSAVVWLQ